MTKYQKQHEMCEKLIAAFAGNEVNDPQPFITMSKDGRRVDVVWTTFFGMNDIERSEMICEAISCALGQDRMMKLHSAAGYVSTVEKVRENG